MTGRTIGNYRVIERLGEGGMGKVYRALDLMIEREVALKSLRPEIASQPGVLDRFRSEAVLLARLNHPAIAQLYTFFKEGDEFHMVMEYVAGETLERVLQNRGALPWPVALSCMTQLLEGLSHAHSLGILHRDLKPANVILTPGGKVKIMDFGIAQALGGSRLTREGRIIGTLEYLAPERIQGKPADVRSDVYSAGILLYEMLTGNVPFGGDSEYELLTAQVHRRPPSPRELGIELPPAVEAALMTALEKDPARRPSSAASFAAVLAALTSSSPTEQPAEPKPVPKATRLATEPARRRPSRPLWIGLIAAGAVAASALLAGGLMLLRQPQRAPAPPETASSQPAAVAPPQPEVPMTPAPVPLPEPAPAEPIVSILPWAAKAPAPTPSAASRNGSAPAPKATARDTRDRDPRDGALAALDETDGPAKGEPGSRPIHLAGVLAALKVGARPAIGDIREAIARRGVNFLLTPGNREVLRPAGATPELLRDIERNYRAPEQPVFVQATPAPEPTAPQERTGQSPGPGRHVRSLSDVRKLYVAPAEYGLDQEIREELIRQIGNRFELVPSASAADGLLRVTVEEQRGGTISRAGRFLGVNDRARVRAIILEAGTTHILWEQAAGDRKPIAGAFRGESRKRLAERIVKELRQDLERSAN
jgi:serine/threonine-protein kinase